ncbi:MAG TPA: hypothetical protein VNO30_19895 [Kofleriaceae bacterium]|nr:hypothetical protein [Kofleriaceae bacterium]
MHRLAPVLLVLALALASSGCSWIEDVTGLGAGDDACGDACEATEKALGLADRNVHHRREKTFTSDGVAYTLVRFEYGDTEECDDLGDCSYSTYCGFRVDGKDFPLEVSWVTDADALFDPAEYCEDGELAGCELPGQTLPILDDPDFEDWMYETDPDADVLVECFADYW